MRWPRWKTSPSGRDVLKTILVDSELGGAGKAFVARAMVDWYLYGQDRLAQNQLAVILVESGDVTRLTAPQGYRLGGAIQEILSLDLGSDAGWIQLGDDLDRLAERSQVGEPEVRVVIPFPSRAGNRVIAGREKIISRILERGNTLPVWVLRDDTLSLEALRARRQVLPAIFDRGLVFRNALLYRAMPPSRDPVQAELQEWGGWMLRDFPEAGDGLKPALSTQRADLVAAYGQLSLGWKMVFGMWRERVWRLLEDLEVENDG